MLLLPVSTAMSQSWLRGSWEGTGYQIDDNTTWPMKLTITQPKNRGRTFSIDYPSLNCGGRWKLQTISPRQAIFREQLRHGQDKCANNGRVRIDRVSNKQILFLYSYKGIREISASAVLNRKRS
jgi:hypothetical protein